MSLDLPWVQRQGCQLSQIIRETPDFEPFLPISRLESEISWIITEVCHFLLNRLSDNEISNSLHCLSYFTIFVSSQTPVRHCDISNNVIGISNSLLSIVNIKLISERRKLLFFKCFGTVTKPCPN